MEYKEKIFHYAAQSISSADIKSVKNVLRSDFITQGPEVEKFEDDLKNYVGSNYAFAVNSATAGLHLACLSLGVNSSSRVWVAAISFVATANCAEYCGASVSFCDVDKITGLIDLEKLEFNLSKASIAGTLPDVIIVVHLTGQSVNMKKLFELKEKYHFKIIEDASHALGAIFNNKFIGNCEFSEIAVSSFHAIKMITSGEGGVIFTNKKFLANIILSMRSHGVLKKDIKNQEKNSYIYDQETLGFNYRMPDILAALGKSQLSRIESFIRKRNQLALRYNKSLRKYHEIISIPEIKSGNERCSFHIYQIKLKNNCYFSRDVFFDKLKENKIISNVHYIPIYRHSYYKRKYQHPILEGAEHFFGSVLCLPLYVSLSFKEQMEIIRRVKKVFDE
jgi:UDP-4-amino-4,6-dideoxy-N-acetyl-beta-L-altrosamine transaminase